MKQAILRHLVLIGATAMALGRTPACAAPQDVTLAIPTVSFTFTAAYVAEDAGIWAKRGLRVKVLHILGIGSLNAVIAKSADFANITGGAFTRAAAHGQRLLAIANTVDRPMVELVLRKEIASAAGFDPHAPLAVRGRVLRGRTISAGGVNSVLDEFVKIVALRAGLDPEKDIRMAPMEAYNVFPSFESKAIDGFALSEPWTIQAVRDGDAVLVASAPAGDFPEFAPLGYDLVVTRPELCQERPGVCDEMGHAFVDAVDFMYEQPKKTLAILKKRFGKIDDDLLSRSFEMILKATPRPPVVTKADLEHADDYNVTAGIIGRDQKLKSYDGLFTDKYVR